MPSRPSVYSRADDLADTAYLPIFGQEPSELLSDLLAQMQALALSISSWRQLLFKRIGRSSVSVRRTHLPNSCGKRAAAIMSLIDSARMYGHDPCAYLNDGLTQRVSEIEQPLRINGCFLRGEFGRRARYMEVSGKCSVEETTLYGRHKVRMTRHNGLQSG